MICEADAEKVAHAPLVLATYCARYTHTALGLRWLVANLDNDVPKPAWYEFEMRLSPSAAVERILRHRPRVVALGVYIWNVERTVELVRLLRAQSPELVIVLGGPEVSAAPHEFPAFDLIDTVIVGEAEIVFGDLCRCWLAGERPVERVIYAPLPDLGQLALPYHLYTDKDLQTRHIYVETTRGCPYRCDFCTSGGVEPLRNFPLEATLMEVQQLAERGARTLRFVDRTFNAKPARAAAILNALLPWAKQGLRVHLEFTPQAKYHEDLQAALCAWPVGQLHIEVGVQSLNHEVARRIRRPGITEAEAALSYLIRVAGADVHVDLIAGLPGEDERSIAASFDRLWALGPQEIQLGVLKHLPGTALDRHLEEWEMQFASEPPYALMHSKTLSSEALHRITCFAAYWERLANHRHFPRSIELILQTDTSPYRAFMRWSVWLFQRVGRAHSLALEDLLTDLYLYLTQEQQLSPDETRRAQALDFLAEGRRPERAMPKILR